MSEWQPIDRTKLKIPKPEVTTEPTTGPWFNKETMKRVQEIADALEDFKPIRSPNDPPTS